MIQFFFGLIISMVVLAVIFTIGKKIENYKYKNNYEYRYCNKTIYVKDKGITNKKIKEILNLEIKIVLESNPGFALHKYLGFVKNEDLSQTYSFIFRKKKVQTK